MWSAEEFEAKLRAVGDERYHHRHPFNLRMHEGALRPEEIRCWVRNRYYYQTRIPVKDSRILTKSDDAPFRREWVQRIQDHDGSEQREGGLELWLRLGVAVGLDRDEVERQQRILPGVRRACDAYVEFVESHDLLSSVAASLTERFAGDIMKVRIAAFEKHYPWVRQDGLDYFKSRTTQAPRDAAFGLKFVTAEAKNDEDQKRCVAALERKCEILWNLLDAVEAANRRPTLSPHVALRKDSEEAGKWVAVLPERAMRINASGRAILDACDGSATCDEIAMRFAATHSDDDGVYTEVHEFLERMRRQGAVELEA